MEGVNKIALSIISKNMSVENEDNSNSSTDIDPGDTSR